MFTCSKLFQYLSSAYRNHESKTDCYMLHGYSRDVFVEFGAKEPDKQGFIIDYGGLKDISRWLEDNFDHTTVLQADDPLVKQFRELEKDGYLKLTVLPMISAEGWAMYIAKYIQQEIDKQTNGRAWVNFVEVRENGKNASRYHNKILDTSQSAFIDTDTINFEQLEELAEDMENGFEE